MSLLCRFQAARLPRFSGLSRAGFGRGKLLRGSQTLGWQLARGSSGAPDETLACIRDLTYDRVTPTGFFTPHQHKASTPWRRNAWRALRAEGDSYATRSYVSIRLPNGLRRRYQRRDHFGFACRAPAEKAHSPAAKKPPTRGATNAVEQTVYETKVKPFLAAHCFKCHDDSTTRRLSDRHARHRFSRRQGGRPLEGNLRQPWPGQDAAERGGPPQGERRHGGDGLDRSGDSQCRAEGQEFVGANAAIEPHGIFQHSSRSVRSRRKLRPQSWWTNCRRTGRSMASIEPGRRCTSIKRNWPSISNWLSGC